MNDLCNILWIIVTLLIVIFITYITRKRGYVSLTALYCTMAVTSAIAATKIVSIFGLFVPGGVIIYAASFLVTDLISEIYGKKAAMIAVYHGWGAMVIFALYSLLIVDWEAAPYWTNQEGFESVVGLSFRITMAGWISFLISQKWDVWIFHLLKESSKQWINKRLWVRNILSTVTSQVLDTVIFITISFYGIYEDLWGMILAQYLIKLVIAVVDTPFAYLGRKILKSEIIQENN